MSSMSLIDNVQDVHFASSLDIDKIIGTYTGSFTLNSPTAGNTNTVTTNITTNINDTTLFTGIYSLDNGVSWNPFYTRKNHVESADPAVNPQGESTVYGESTAGTFKVIGKNTANLSATVFYDFTVLYKVALIAKSNQGTIEPQPLGADIIFDTRLNYQKIAVDNITATSGSNQTTTVNHNLDYIPRVRVFIESSSGTLAALDGFIGTVSINETSVASYIGGSYTGNVHTRIYYDA